MSISESIAAIGQRLAGTPCRLIAVSKTKPVALLQEAYAAGCRRFGENRVQEMVEKQPCLPPDTEWHLIGHLQTNKVKYIAPFVTLIHSVDSLKLLQEIDRQAARHQRVIDCLLQIHIAREDTKSGLDYAGAEALLAAPETAALGHVRIAGLMGLATFTDDREQVRAEFRGLRQFYEKVKAGPLPPNALLHELSMGMSGDYDIAIEEGSTLIRVGSALFGSRA